MNGTSIDGADFVLTQINSKTLKSEFLMHTKFEFSKQLKMKLRQCAQHQMNVAELALLHHDLGRYYADCYKKLPKKYRSAKVIGLHGQTVFHKGGVATLQIGEPSYLAAVSGKILVSDFRAADIALGGQGAPIATFFHEHTFGIKNKLVSIHNLGGISNLSLIKNRKLIAGYDTGPANMLLDLTVQKFTNGKLQYDDRGKLAASGTVNSDLLKEFLKHSYFKKRPPKSCGREEFGELFLDKHSAELAQLSIEDQLATLTELVAITIAAAYKSTRRPETIYFCGGGAMNEFLLSRIQKLLETVEIKTTLEAGWPSESIEGAAFALLAFARVLDKTSSNPKTTGAARSASLGKITAI